MATSSALSKNWDGGVSASTPSCSHWRGPPTATQTEVWLSTVPRRHGELPGRIQGGVVKRSLGSAADRDHLAGPPAAVACRPQRRHRSSSDSGGGTMTDHRVKVTPHSGLVGLALRAARTTRPTVTGVLRLRWRQVPCRLVQGVGAVMVCPECDGELNGSTLGMTSPAGCAVVPGR